MALRIRLLGGLDVDGVEAARLGSRKGRRLVTRLALARGAPVGADALAEVVWPEGPPANPADQVSVLVSRARSALGADRLPRTDAGYRLVVDWLDLAAFEEYAAEARRRLDAGAPGPARAAAAAALDLLRGPLAPEEPPESAWLDAERAALARTAGEVRRVAAGAALAAGDPWAAAAQAEEALAGEPYDEEALRLLMAAHASTGRTALALRAYADTARRLVDELGVDPSPRTRAAHLALLRSADGPAPASTPARAPGPLPGRDTPLAALAAELALARGGTARLVRVEGEAGIGKTRLLEAWTAGLDGLAVLRGAADELAGNLPLQPVFDALAAHLTRAGADVAADLLAGDAALLHPFVGGPAGAVPATLALLTGGPAGGQSLLFAALDTVVSRLAGAGPVVLALDDGQWADRATVAWLHHAVRRHAGRPLLLVVASRGDPDLPLRADATIALGPLDAAACAAAVGEPPGSARARWLHARSGGHPLFLAELARAGAGPDAAVVSESVRAAVSERCDACGPDAAATLRAAAVLGPLVDLDLLATVLDAPVTGLLDHLETGVRHRLLVERGPGFAFAHQLLRDALAAGTGSGRAALLHRRAAAVLAARSRNDPLEVAYHARAGGDAVLGATALDRAAQLCLARYDYVEARRFLDRAIALDDRPELRVRLGWALLLLDDRAAALAEAEAAGRLGAGPAALELSATVHYQLRDFPRALADVEAALAATAGDPGAWAEVRASCLGLAGRIKHATGELATAQQLYGRALHEAPPSIRPLVEMWVGHLRLHMGRYDRAIAAVTGGGPVSMPAAHPSLTVYRHGVLAMARAMRGEPMAALRALLTAEEAGRREHIDRYDGFVANVRGWVLRNLGEHAAADDANTAGYELARRGGLSEPVAHALLDLADGRLRAGDPAGAAALLDRLAVEAPDEYSFRWRADLRARLLAGRTALAGGDPGAALDAARALRGQAAAVEVGRFLVQAELLEALARRAAGERPDPAGLEPLVVVLARHAPLEAWWLTAELAEAFDVPAWRRTAHERAAELIANAGPYADTLRAVVSARLSP